ncbi:hypothetical protein G7Y89_g2992 [Cudoniella acicularis]|uniref:Heterokaryon incompatibility domain-containing protein n=1 Tax=Cudoniella acicularis TaxID=354080 RepID=A0A8H4RS91_9HELO|nr:hypothetical protein G7Y89_g2992 [Cudoniella acicularis]
MESNRSEKRRNTTPDYYPHKRQKADDQCFDDEAVDKYEPPERARRTGYPPRGSTKPGTSQTALHDLVLPRSTYEHDTIKEDSIRLLYLRPGSRDEPINCDLKIFNRCGEIPQYEALSYVWGPAPAVHEVQVEGKSFYTGPNLYNALRNLRQHSSTSIFWIDAMCIDQSNDREKGEQVMRMAEIYQNARNVVVWLGEKDSDSDDAMDFVPRLLDPSFLSDGNWPSTYARGFYALAHLLERSWFSRIWVLQEVAYARNIVLKCGDHEVHFMDFIDACNIVKSKLDTIKRCLQNTPLYDSYGHLLHNFQDSSAARLFDLLRNVFIRSNDGKVIGRRLSLESLVCDLAPFQATDPRDSIFALLGLTKDADILSGFRPDYCKSVLDVYSQFTSACTRTSGSLDIICRPWAPRKKTVWQDNFVDPELRFRVPSWIPIRGDLPFGDPKCKIKKRVNADILVGSARKKVYNAHNGIHAQVRFGVDDLTGTSDGSMNAKGLILCRISELSNRMPDGFILKEGLEVIGGIIRDERSNLEAMEDSVWRTLCANRDENGDPPPSVYRIAALHLLQTSHGICSIDTEEMLEASTPEYQKEFLKRVQAVIWNRRIFRAQELNITNSTEGSLIGLVPRDSRNGDHICILFGVSVPVVLRHHQKDTTSCWQLVGEAYVDGRMDGEELCSLSKEDLASKTVEFQIW